VSLSFRLLQEADADLVALDVDQLSFAVGVADRRQHEEELVELDVLDAALDRELGAARRDHLDVALAPPGAVDAHDARLEARLEHDLVGALEFSFLAHRVGLPTHATQRDTRGRTGVRVAIFAHDSKSAVNACRAAMLNSALPGGGLGLDCAPGGGELAPHRAAVDLAGAVERQLRHDRDE